jgi:hypothetical protein
VSVLLQELLVGVLVLGCAIYSAWRLLSQRLRLRVLDALAALPLISRSAWFVRLRERTLSAGALPCGSCAGGVKRAAGSANQTPGVPRR